MTKNDNGVWLSAIVGVAESKEGQALSLSTGEWWPAHGQLFTPPPGGPSAAMKYQVVPEVLCPDHFCQGC